MENTQNAGEGLILAGRYRLGDSIGRGGMGRVWRAHDELLHRVVAVKELTAGMYASESDRARLHARTQKEARAAARITHPGVVTVHDVLEHDARPWIVMQYVEGGSLADATKESGGLTPLKTARIGLKVLDALGAAHAAGVLHRDVKPANVLLALDGGVLLTDFGIAVIEGDSTITRTGEIVGSIDYLAPERVRGGDPGPACDLWSLGVTLYAALTGASPFRRTSPLGTMRAVVAEEPEPLEGAGPLGPVVMALLAKEPEARPDAVAAGRLIRAAVAELERAETAETAGFGGATLAATAVLPPGSGPGPGTSGGNGSGSVTFPEAAGSGGTGGPTGVTGTFGPTGSGEVFPPAATGSPELLGPGPGHAPVPAGPAAPLPAATAGMADSGTSGTSATTPSAVAAGPESEPPSGRSRRRRNAKGAKGATGATGPRKRGRMRLVAAVVALSAVVGGTAGFDAMRYAGDGDGGGDGAGARKPTT
ncbi:serine/threonine-protein kinase, partial [Streptomyces sp. NPDC058953]|uniref:serine/threonine-protein kinase n=1 Tax=Streptomyces sp. NPDC058953 TaxID=3346676 RepID=UPI0036C82FF3